jgi:hypothetical protein
MSSKLQAWRLSWYGPLGREGDPNPIDTCFQAEFPCWITGHRFGPHKSIQAILVATIQIHADDDPKEYIRLCYKTKCPPETLEWRFCEKMSPTQSPFSDRFPRYDGVRWNENWAMEGLMSQSVEAITFPFMLLGTDNVADAVLSCVKTDVLGDQPNGSRLLLLTGKIRNSNRIAASAKIMSMEFELQQLSGGSLSAEDSERYDDLIRDFLEEVNQ